MFFDYLKVLLPENFGRDRSQEIKLCPVSDLVERDLKMGLWESTGDNPQFALEMPKGSWPSGWVYLESRISVRSTDYSARLYFDTGNGCDEASALDIPFSLKGTISELVYFPSTVSGVFWEPLHSPDLLQQSSFRISEISGLSRIYRMLRRVIPVLFQRPRGGLEALGLSFMRLFVDLQGAYTVSGKLRTYAAAPVYREWVTMFCQPSVEDCLLINRHIERLKQRPNFRILITSDGDAESVQQTVDSLNEQMYRYFTYELMHLKIETNDDRAGELFVNGMHAEVSLGAFKKSISESNSQVSVVLLCAGDVLSPDALYRFACESIAKPNAAVLYADDDILGNEGTRCNPRFKPDWSLTHFRSTNFIGNAVAIRCDAIAAAGGLSQKDCKHGSYDLLLRVVDVVGAKTNTAVAHIPSILMHRRVELDKATNKHLDWNAPKENINALHAHLARNGVEGEVVETFQDCWRVHFSLPDERPLVSIIVPTRDEPALIRQCVESLLEKTTYSRFEMLVVDNQSTDQEALAYLEKISRHEKIRVLSYDHPFNFSSMNNFAVREMRGEVVCLLNNDTEVISPDWLEEMVGHLLQPQVGVVGAKLYYPNGQVQHGGDLVGVGGVANHAHAFLKRDDPGYCNRAVVAQELSAVTAACMVTWKSIYEELGGLDEEHLKVAFNDVDYCLRVREAGYKVVWTPHAELDHHESVSRGKDSSPEKKRRAAREAAYMRKRWKNEMQND
ncbi:MAG: glycosyltransferase family 2 protein, partial [Gallionella sp.]